MQTKISVFDYKGGRSITDKLKQITKVSDFHNLADVYDIPRSTISTWHTRNMTPFEIVLRTHLATGVSLKWLLLDEGEPFEQPTEDAVEKLSIELISNGKLEEHDTLRIDLTTLQKYRLTPSQTKLVEEDGNIYFINTNEETATSGKYLIDIDGIISINRIQRLPGKKLVISFGDSSIEVAEGDIKIIGRVAMEMKKK